MNKLPTDRNFGYGKQLDWAGHQALLDLYGRGHYATVATHTRRWSRFCAWARAEHGIRDAKHIDQHVIEDYAATLQGQVNEESLSVSYAQNLLSTLNTALEALRRDKLVRLASPSEWVGLRSLVRTDPPGGMDWAQVDALISLLRKLDFRRASSVVRLARNFGLRLREAVLADLHEWRRQAKTFGRIDVREGTKGGRGREVERWVTVSEDGMLAIGEAMHLSQSLGCERNLLRPEESFDSLVNNGEIHRARRHLQAFGIKGYHELRAAWACERYLQETGCPAPVMRGGQIADHDVDGEARRILAKELGHGRIDVVAEYIGARP